MYSKVLIVKFLLPLVLVSLVVYIFAAIPIVLCEKELMTWVEDVSLAFFSGSLLAFLIGLIEYYAERFRRLREFVYLFKKCIDSFNTLQPVTFYYVNSDAILSFLASDKDHPDTSKLDFTPNNPQKLYSEYHSRISIAYNSYKKADINLFEDMQRAYSEMAFFANDRMPQEKMIDTLGKLEYIFRQIKFINYATYYYPDDEYVKFSSVLRANKSLYIYHKTATGEWQIVSTQLEDMNKLYHEFQRYVLFNKKRKKSLEMEAHPYGTRIIVPIDISDEDS